MTTENIQRLLIDTDVIIDHLHNEPKELDYMDSLTEDILISAITLAELYAGVREGTEREQLERFIDAFEVVPIESEISRIGGLYRRDYGRSHGTGLPDALIAATAESVQAKLVTLNRRHFPMLTDVIIPYSKG